MEARGVRMPIRLRYRVPAGYPTRRGWPRVRFCTRGWLYLTEPVFCEYFFYRNLFDICKNKNLVLWIAHCPVAQSASPTHLPCPYYHINI
jgi:hypothetical protein